MANWPDYEDYLRGRIYLNNDTGYTRIVSNIDRQKVFAGYHWHQLDVLIGRPETTNISDYYKIGTYYRGGESSPFKISYPTSYTIFNPNPSATNLIYSTQNGDTSVDFNVYLNNRTLTNYRILTDNEKNTWWNKKSNNSFIIRHYCTKDKEKKDYNNTSDTYVLNQISGLLLDRRISEYTTETELTWDEIVSGICKVNLKYNFPDSSEFEELQTLKNELHEFNYNSTEKYSLDEYYTGDFGTQTQASSLRNKWARVYLFNEKRSVVFENHTAITATPTINYNTRVLSWNANTDANNGYEIYRDGAYWKTVQTNQVTLSVSEIFEKHSYKIRVNRNKSLILSKEKSNLYTLLKQEQDVKQNETNLDKAGVDFAELVYVAYNYSNFTEEIVIHKLATPENISHSQISVDSVQLNWSNVPNASTYKVVLNWSVGGVADSKTLSSAYNSILLTNLDITSYTVTIQATSDIYDNSTNSAPYTFTVSKLSAPTISKNTAGDGIEWPTYDTVTNKATSYVVEDKFTGEWIYLNTVSTLYYLLDTDATKMSPGVHEFRVKAIYTNQLTGEEVSKWSSDWSNTIQVTIQTLDSPVITFVIDSSGDQTSDVTWTAITGAEYYNIYVDDVKINTTPITTTTYTALESIYGDRPGYYKVQVRAMSVNILYEDSANSNSIFYTVAKLSKPTNIDLTSEGVLTWDAVTNEYYQPEDITVYDVYLNDEFVETTISPRSTLTIPAGSYANIAYVQARCSTQAATRPNPRFIPSDYSDVATIGKLKTPENISVNNNGELIWDAVENAKIYEIYNSGVALKQTNSTRFTIPNKIPATYVFSIKALGWGNLITSDSSSALTVVVRKLESPTIVLNSTDNYISWNYIQYAEKYDVYINGYKITSTAGNRYNFDESTLSGTNEFYVVANSDSKLIIESDKSNVVILTKQLSYENYVRIRENGELSEPIAIEMPLNIQEKRDDSLDTGVVTLALNSRKEPYPAYTGVNVYLAPDNGLGTYKTWYMIVVNDTVQSMPVGKKRLYSHTIQLVSRSRFLQTIVIPNMTVTQPQEFVYRSYEQSDNTIPCNKGKNIVFTRDYGMRTGGDRKHARNNLFYSGLNNDIIGNVYANMNPYYEFKLPYESTKYIEGTEFRLFWNVRIYDLVDKIIKGNNRINMNEKIYLTQRWYIRKSNVSATDQYSKDSNRPEQLIGVYQTGADVTKVPKFKFADNSYYLQNKDTKYWDLILEIDDPSILYSPQGNQLEWDGTYVRKPTGLMSSDEITLNEPFDKSYENSYAYFTFDADSFEKTYRIVWNGIQVADTVEKRASLGNVVTIGDVLQKLCYIANTITTDDTPKYSIDQKILDKVGNIACYQLKFEGKTFYECLETIGKEFFGVPYLVEDTNIITFRILNDDAIIIKDDKDLLETKASTIENNSTGFITNASNVISDNNVETYPGNNMWITPRSTDDNSALISTESCGIVVDKPIAYLKDVTVTNFDDSGREVSIIGYIYEQSVYNSLSKTKQGKGTALYWSIGQNKIYGLGILPELSETELKAALGLSNTNYVIQNIIKARTNINMDNSKVKDLKFRVVYIPYTSTNIYTEKFNTSQFEESVYKVFNQTDAVLSDSAFGASLNKEMQRLGNNSITKQFVVGNINQCPKIGDAIIHNNEIYYVNVISYEFSNQLLTCNVEYTKDYNRINPRMGIDSDYREYEIYNSDYTNRTVNINHYCYISTNQFANDINSASKNGIWQNIISDSLNGNPSDTLEYFYCNVYNLDDKQNLKPVTYKDYSGNDVSINKGLLLHATRLDLRNSICFTGSMQDNFSAGTYANKSNTINGKYAADYARYVDELGKVKVIEVALANPNKSELYTTDPDGRSSYEFPYCDKVSGDLKDVLNDCLFNNTYYVDKDNREKLTFTYQMHFKTDEKPFTLHQAMTRYLFKNNGNTYNYSKAIIVGYKGNIKNSEFLNYSNDDILGEVLTYASGLIPYIKGIDVTPNYDYDGFAIVYPHTPYGTGELILSYEMKLTRNTDITLPDIYFNLTDKLNK